jgi:O-antigen ligase
MHVKKQKENVLFLCLIAVLISSIGFVSPQAAKALSIVFSAFLIAWANPLGLPALAILWIQAIDFCIGTNGVEVELPGAIFVAGFPLTLSLATLFFITTRVLWEWLVRPKTFGRSRWLTLSFMLWLAFFLITLASGFMGKSLGHTNWTQPLRASMALATLFFGIIVAGKLKDKFWVVDWLLRIVVFVLLLMLLGLYWNHVGFLYIAIGACSLWLMIRQKRWLLAALCGLSSIHFTNSTLTIIAIIALGLLSGFFLFSAKKCLHRSMFSAFTALILPFSLFLIVVVLFLPVVFPFNNVGTDTDLKNRIVFKLYKDRGPLWRAAWDTAIIDLSTVSPSGSSLSVDHPMTRSSGNLWNIHVHNSFLEMLRQTGFPGAVVFFIVFLRFWLKLRSALLQPLPPVVLAFGGAALITSAVGATTGLFPFDFHAGPWIWLWAGIAIGLSQSRHKSISTIPTG